MAILNKVVRKVLAKVIVESRFEGDEGANHAEISRESVPHSTENRCKSPKVGEWYASGKAKV